VFETWLARSPLGRLRDPAALSAIAVAIDYF